MDDDFEFDLEYESHLWRPVEMHGWTWVPRMEFAPELYSLLDADGEMMGVVYQRFNRVICWAPYTWAEEAYRSEEDVGRHGFDSEAQRQRHFARITRALAGWVRRKREDGVDIPLLRDTHAYYFETGNGHEAVTAEEFNHPYRPRRGERTPAVKVDGWLAERAWGWHCEGHWLRDPTGQLRGSVQVRLGVVRAVAAQARDADRVDPARRAEDDFHTDRATCRGQIVLQERLRPMANAFADGEREAWLRRAVDAVRTTPNPDRSWPAGTLGAWGTEGQQMLPGSGRAPWQPGAFKGLAPVPKAAGDARAMRDALGRAACRRVLEDVFDVLADRIAADPDWWVDVTRTGRAHVGVDDVVILVADDPFLVGGADDGGPADGHGMPDLVFRGDAAKANIRRKVEDWFDSERG